MSELVHKGDRAPELDQVMETFSTISESLVHSYEALTERARPVEEELGRTYRHLEAVLQALPTGVIVRDSAGEVVRVNDAALSILGVGQTELRAGSIPFAPEQSDDTTAIHDLERRGERQVLATRRSEILGADGEALGTVEVVDDRTELTDLSERMHTMDKMAALGTMGAGIAHEIRNPLNAVLGFAKLLERELEGGSLEDPAKAARWATKIAEGATEADAIIESLLAFANPERLKSEVIDPEELADSALRAGLPEGMHETGPWSVEVRCNAPAFLGDHLKLRQALRNLIANAIQVQPDGGALAVSILDEDGGVVLRVCDAGPGVPADHARRVLDPFFTTRPDGTGLGLALVSTIARLHGGEVEVGTSPDLGGAQFTLRLPLKPAPTGHDPKRES